MSDAYYERTIALAGLFQALKYVQMLANEGTNDSSLLKTAQRSVLTLDAINTQSVFGEFSSLQQGLYIIERLFCQTRHSTGDLELTRYCMQVIQLERKLSKNPDMLRLIAERLDNLSSQIDAYEFSATQISSSLSGLYEDTISTLTPRIMVFGKEENLQPPNNASSIRAALFAAIRAAVLWHQKGGRRLQFVFSRKHYCSHAKNILKRIDAL